MKVVFGMIGLALGVLFFCFILLAARRPKQPWWMSDFWVANVHIILILCFFITGIMLFVSSLSKIISGEVGKVELLISLLVAIATVICIKAMQIPKRLKAYSAQSCLHGEAGSGDDLNQCDKEGKTPSLAG